MESSEVSKSESTDWLKFSSEEWESRLTKQQYEITRMGQTEKAFTGIYWKSKESGDYHCICCGEKLFSSKTKFDSGTGWPSFWDAINKTAITTDTDASNGMLRTEINCSKCKAHLGHLFNDGPNPTGNHYCVNSASLNFIYKKTKY